MWVPVLIIGDLILSNICISTLSNDACPRTWLGVGTHIYALSYRVVSFTQVLQTWVEAERRRQKRQKNTAEHVKRGETRIPIKIRR